VTVEPLQGLKKDSRITIKKGVFMDEEARIIKVFGNKVKVIIDSIGFSLIATIDKSNVALS
jgi:transcription antitermination factor NusG